MSSNLTPHQPPSEAPALRGPSSAVRGPWSVVPALALFAVVWANLLRLLSTQWETREQYAYGWFVPIFAAALLWRRWLDRPAVSGAQSFPGGPLSVVSSPPSAVSGPLVPWSFSPLVPWSLGFVVLLLAFLLPLRVIYEINTDWPLISWVYTLIVVAVTLYAFFLAGGMDWVRHFAFPVCFILVAVVWPYRIEKGLTQNLMQVVASLTVELLGWIDIPAIQRGNLIELSTGTLGIEEACSGIRSFQSSLMAGLLMGELYRFRIRGRVALVALGITLAFCFNIVRTLLLSYQANAHGLEVIEKWHDPAGFSITVACFLTLWGLAVLMQRRFATSEPAASPSRSTDHVSRIPTAASPSRFTDHVSRFLLLTGCWSLVLIGVTEVWYRAHTPKDSGVFHWSVALPEGKPSFEKTQLAPRTIKLLKYDLAATGKWRVEDGSEWSVNFFRWQPRSIESVINSRIHRPEVCLPASGFHQLAGSKLIRVEAKGLKLPFRKYTYEMDGHLLYVFFCQWEDGAEDQVGMQSSGQDDRLESVRKGRRLVGQQTLEIIVSDCPSLDQAEKQLRADLPGIIHLEPKSVVSLR